MTARTILAALVIVLGAGLSGACASDPAPSREARGAQRVSIPVEGGAPLAGRLWAAHPTRIVIYLHEFRQDQTSWWTHAETGYFQPVSRLTFDFRGHGDSAGDPGDIPGMLDDARAAVAWARAQGYAEIVLGGAGMGGTIAIIAGAEEDVRGVFALSAAAQFDVLDAAAVAPALGERLALAATQGDLSAAHSIEVFREVARLGVTRAPLYPGRTHGVEMLVGRAGADVRVFIRRAIEGYWQTPASRNVAG